MLRALLFAVLILPCCAHAQEQVMPDDFLDEAVGQTLTFRAYRSDNLVGVEQFLRRDLSVWTDPRGRCTYGRIEIRGPQICFIYDDDPDDDNCWLIFEEDGQYLVMSDRELQRITKFETRNLGCGGAPLS